MSGLVSRLSFVVALLVQILQDVAGSDGLWLHINIFALVERVIRARNVFLICQQQLFAPHAVSVAVVEVENAVVAREACNFVLSVAHFYLIYQLYFIQTPSEYENKYREIGVS